MLYESNQFQKFSRKLKGSREMAYKVIVDFDLCESNALCMKEAPEVFLVNDEDYLDVLNETPGEELREKVMAAIHRCPKQAISLDEG